MTETTAAARIIKRVEAALGVEIRSVTRPKQGMGSSVLIVTDDDDREMAVKIGTETANDALALELVGTSGAGVPVPGVLASFAFEDMTVLVMEKVDAPLLEEADKDGKRRYLGPMLACLKKIHTIGSDRAGLLTGADGDRTWKEILLFRLSGEHPLYPWEEIARRDGVDAGLLSESIARLREDMRAAELPIKNYSLLHTDFNQRNLFVDPQKSAIASVIDWGEAMFGDPLYDFARVRMFIYHFDLGQRALSEYHDGLDMDREEELRERLYLTSQMIEYIAWYSMKKNDFNDGRLKLHQEFLRNGLSRHADGRR